MVNFQLIVALKEWVNGAVETIFSLLTKCRVTDGQMKRHGGWKSNVYGGDWPSVLRAQSGSMRPLVALALGFGVLAGAVSAAVALPDIRSYQLDTEVERPAPYMTAEGLSPTRAAAPRSLPVNEVAANGGMPSAAAVIEGVSLGPGVECPQFRMDTAEQISLSGVDRGSSLAMAGGRFRLSGRWTPMSKCMQGRTFRVTSIEIL